MSREEYIINNTFQCPDCGLMYYEEDRITVRTINNNLVHDCDNCLAAIELVLENNKINKK